jgi:hypothetical protein
MGYTADFEVDAWVRVKNGDNEHFSEDGFVTVMDVDVDGEAGCEVQIHGTDQKISFRYSELERYSTTGS